MFKAALEKPGDLLNVLSENEIEISGISCRALKICFFI